MKKNKEISHINPDIYDDIDLKENPNIQEEVAEIETELSITIPNSTNTEMTTAKRSKATKNKVFIEIEPEVKLTQNNSKVLHGTKAENDISHVSRGSTEAKTNLNSVAAQNTPATSYFPLHIGGTARGAIAIANSFSTGDGGSATSHAMAYGSPMDVAKTHSQTRNFI